MSQCWSSRPEDRPTASEVIEKLTAFGFEIFPGVDRREIAAFIHHIQKREFLLDKSDRCRKPLNPLLRET
jgi:hypothetical protein